MFREVGTETDAATTLAHLSRARETQANPAPKTTPYNREKHDPSRLQRILTVITQRHSGSGSEIDLCRSADPGFRLSRRGGRRAGCFLARVGRRRRKDWPV